MKLVEAMKTVKRNKEKIADLQEKIGNNCANYSHETLEYGDKTKEKVAEWIQSCEDLSQENVRLLVAIQRTNLATKVLINLGEKEVLKTIAEWVWRRREYAKIDATTFARLTNRGLKEEAGLNQTTGSVQQIKLVRQYDPIIRDEKLLMYKQEPSVIDQTLEVINATTDLIEA